MPTSPYSTLRDQILNLQKVAIRLVGAKDDLGALDTQTYKEDPSWDDFEPIRDAIYDLFVQAVKESIKPTDSIKDWAMPLDQILLQEIRPIRYCISPKDQAVKTRIAKGYTYINAITTPQTVIQDHRTALDDSRKVLNAYQHLDNLHAWLDRPMSMYIIIGWESRMEVKAVKVKYPL